jgi:protocatechuate 3,4-dioxygenase beta subunit
MKIYIIILSVLSLFSFSACSQNASQKQNPSGKTTLHIGGPCEGCEAIYESAIPLEQLNETDTLPDFNEPGPKIAISGIIYQADGKTPAPGVVLYVYHTNQKGIYPNKGDEKGWAKRHGYIRGWVKTDNNGFYQFFTLRPAPYPEQNAMEHIHVTVKEHGKNEYWLSEYMFDDDPLLTAAKRKLNQHRGGNGIIKLVPQANGILHGTRHIILGLNVPDYPYTGLPKIKSGLAIGANCPAFDPVHLSGADSGKTVCPMCKYGYGQGVMVWFNHANLDQLSGFAKKLESEIEKRGEKKFRVFLVYMNPFYKQNSSSGEEILGRKIRKWCDEQGLKRVAMVWVPSPADAETCGLYKINPDAKNTVFVYKKRTIVDKWVNVEYNDDMLSAILQKIDSPTL